MSQRNTSPDYLNGVPELLLLKILSQQPAYGYQLVQMIRAAGDEFRFGEGCIYPILHRLQAEGLVTSRRETVAGRNRVIYEVTKAGLKRLGESARTWTAITRSIERLLQGEASHDTAMA